MSILELIAGTLYTHICTQPVILTVLIGLAIVPASVMGYVVGVMVTAQDSYYDDNRVHRLFARPWPYRGFRLTTP